MGWGFDIFQKFAVKFRAHGQIIPVNCNQISPPWAAHMHCCQISQSRTQERHNKNISKYNSAIFIYITLLYHRRDMFLLQLTLQLYVLTIIRVALCTRQKPLVGSPHFVRLNIPFLISKGYKESQFYKLTVIVANEPYTDQLYLQKSTWFLFTSVYFDTTVS